MSPLAALSECDFIPPSEDWPSVVLREVVWVDLGGVLANRVECANRTVELGGRVVRRRPNGLAVVGVSGAREVLLLALIDDWNAIK